MVLNSLFEMRQKRRGEWPELELGELALSAAKFYEVRFWPYKVVTSQI